MLDIESEKTPAGAGFRMPAEWHSHSCTWLAWPHNRETWPLNLLAAQSEFLHLLRAIATDEPAIVIASKNAADDFNDRMRRADLIDLPIWLVEIPTNDAWIRDYGPTFVTSKQQLLAIDWQYNAWGGKYPPFDKDQQVVTRVISQMPCHIISDPVHRYTSELHLEGGAIDVNEDGVLLCTRSCALDPNRNPDFSMEMVEQELRNCLGVSEIIWLGGDAILGDDTDGHIDQLARFVPGDRIVIASTPNRDDPQYAALEQNRNDLLAGLLKLKLDYELVELPMPDSIELAGRRLPASYCNFCITNRSVIVPQFDRPQDEKAVEIISAVFPNHSVKGSPSKELIAGLGSFHCLTQHQPAVET
jgi:agmatine deiminase